VGYESPVVLMMDWRKGRYTGRELLAAVVVIVGAVAIIIWTGRDGLINLATETLGVIASVFVLGRVLERRQRGRDEQRAMEMQPLLLREVDAALSAAAIQLATIPEIEWYRRRRPDRPAIWQFIADAASDPNETAPLWQRLDARARKRVAVALDSLPRTLGRVDDAIAGAINVRTLARSAHLGD
jgi:hypothetical protein